MTDTIKFGASGNSESFYNAGFKHTEQTPAYLEKFGLDCFEYSFGRGVRITDEKALSIAEKFREKSIEISVHAPYYINFSNESDENVEKSYQYVIDSAKAVKLMGGDRVVVHPATQGKLERKASVDLCYKRLLVLAEKLKKLDLGDVKICLETMGKLAQIGSLDEIVYLCKADDIYLPTVDFGHINAREQGSLKSVEDYKRLLSTMVEKLGFERVKHFHAHFSKIEYGKKGEIRHLTFEDKIYGPEFEPLAIALKEFKLEPHLLSESAGTQTEDACEMKRIYYSI